MPGEDDNLPPDGDSYTEDDAARDELRMYAQAGVWGTCAVLLCTYVSYQVFVAATGLRFPDTPILGWLFAWAWVNGVLIGVIVWSRRSSRFPMGPHHWLKSPNAWKYGVWVSAVSLLVFTAQPVFEMVLQAMRS